MHLENFSNIEFIGRGGFGTVYKGYSEVLKETVAIKKISEKDKSEADLMCQLISMPKKEGKYRNFVHYFDQITKDGMCYIIMEFCKYGSLNDYVAKNGPLNLELLYAPKGPNRGDLMCTWTLLHLIAAVDYLHTKGIMHRDLKPHNVLVYGRGSSVPNTHLVLKIADFGLSKVASDVRAYHTLCGTPMYMAPEVASGHAYGKEADIYSLGAVIYYLGIGEHVPYPTRFTSDGQPNFPISGIERKAPFSLQMMRQDPKNRRKLKDIVGEIKVEARREKERFLARLVTLGCEIY